MTLAASRCLILSPAAIAWAALWRKRQAMRCCFICAEGRRWSSRCCSCNAWVVAVEIRTEIKASLACGFQFSKVTEATAGERAHATSQNSWSQAKSKGKLRFWLYFTIRVD